MNRPARALLPLKEMNRGILYTHQIVAHRAAEMKEVNQILDKSKQICQKAGVFAEGHYVEMNYIKKGIDDFILKNNVKKLVMGAAADKHFSKRMVDVRSKKAVYVKLKAAAFCEIQFICKGNVIFTRQGTLDGVDFSTASTSASPNTTSATDNRRVMSDNRRTKIPTFASPSFNSDSTSTSRLTSRRAFDEWSGISRYTNSRFSSGSSELADDLGQTPYLVSEVSEVQSDYAAVTISKEEVQNPPPLSVIVFEERGMHDELYDQLEQAMAEADTYKQDAFEESIRRRKAEKDAMDARRKEENENIKKEHNEVVEELHVALEQQSYLQSQIAVFNHIVQELEQKMLSAIELLKNYKRERDEIQLECDDALRLVEELRAKQTGEASSSGVSQFYNEFSFTEIQDATRNFDQSLKIGEGGYGSIFRGFLQHTKVAIKMLHSQSIQGPSEFQQELYIFNELWRTHSKGGKMEIRDATRDFDQSLKIGEGGYGSIFRGFLQHTKVAIKMLHSQSIQGPSEFQQELYIFNELWRTHSKGGKMGEFSYEHTGKLRHPNLVTLIGVCPDAWTIIYEYLSGGSLEDRLVIIFLHSCGIIHGDLKPDNILLDKNLVTKVSDLGISRVLSGQEFSNNNTSICRTDPKGTFMYMDLEFLSTRELTSKSDTYSFGVILLRLLTGKPALGLTREVKCALNEKKLKNILDPAAGDWPFVQAHQLAVLAMNCCDMNRQNMPDLASEVWRVLEPMGVSCGLFLFRVGSEGQSQIPHYFVCPIFQ
ncbi:U-box domain-containing protein kinase family protein, partial [Tanacetum coccineum]